MVWPHILLFILYITCTALAMECSRFTDKTVMKVAMDNKCYYASFTMTGTYDQAVNTCRSKDTHVLFTETETEHRRLVRRLGPEFSKIWIGLEKRSADWRWYNDNKSIPVGAMRFADEQASATGTNVIARQLEEQYVWEMQEPHLKFRIVCEQEPAEFLSKPSEGVTESMTLSLSPENSAVIESSVSSVSGALSAQSLALGHGRSSLSTKDLPQMSSELDSTSDVTGQMDIVSTKTRDLEMFHKKAMAPGLEPVLLQRRYKTTVKELDSTNDVLHTITTINTDLQRAAPTPSGVISLLDTRSITTAELLVEMKVSPSSSSHLMKNTVVPTATKRRDQILETILLSESSFNGFSSSVDNADANTAASSEGDSRLGTAPLSSISSLTSEPISSGVKQEQLSVQQATVVKAMAEESNLDGELPLTLTNMSGVSMNLLRQKNRENTDWNRQDSFFGTRGFDGSEKTGFRAISTDVSDTNGSVRTFVLRRDAHLSDVTMVMYLPADSLLDCARACVNRQNICTANAFKNKTCILYSDLMP